MGMKFRAPRALYAVIRPERLLSITDINRFEWRLAVMSRRERLVGLGMPVLREDDVREARSDPMEDRDHLFPSIDSQCTSGAEIVLYIDDK